MRRKLVLVTLFSLLTTGVAFADRGHRGRGHGHHDGRHGGKHDRGGPVVRDHRSAPVRGHAGARVRVTNGRYVFPGGVVRVYKRPKVKRYYDRRVRPAVIVEAYDPVPGYVWVAGNWSWGGSEWVWTPGYWSAEAVVVAPPPPPPPRPRPPTATVQGGVTVSGGISIR